MDVVRDILVAAVRLIGTHDWTETVHANQVCAQSKPCVATSIFAGFGLDIFVTSDASALRNLGSRVLCICFVGCEYDEPTPDITIT